jgi:hypothetical protein
MNEATGTTPGINHLLEFKSLSSKMDKSLLLIQLKKEMDQVD